jgi:phosphate transport system permease protein
LDPTTVIDEPPTIEEPDGPRPVRAQPGRLDRVYRGVASAAGLLTFALMGLVAFFLLTRGRPAFETMGWRFFTTSQWLPDSSNPTFGVAALLYGTFVVAVIANVLAVPVSVATALYIVEYAPRRFRASLTALVDLLAAVPSLIFGIWGLLYLTPKMFGLGRWLDTWLGPILFPFDADGDTYAGSLFIAGVVVAVMAVPIMTSVCREVFSQAPRVECEGALALGGTRWGMIRAVVLPFGRGGIIGGSMLAVGRALGETIAIALVLRPSTRIVTRILDEGGSTVASHIALTFPEASDFGVRALLAAGLTLFAVTLVVNMAASAVVARSRSGAGVEL